MAGPLSVRVVSPDRIVFEGKAASLVAPAWDGKVGILPRHAPVSYTHLTLPTIYSV